MNREILRLAVPSIISNITVPLLGLADVAIVGHIGNETYIGAIAVGSMIFNVVYWLFGFLRMGTSGLTAQAFGAFQSNAGSERPKRSQQTNETLSPNDILRQSLTIAFLAGLTMILLQWPLRLLALWLMQPTSEVAVLVTPYYNICIWGAPAMLGLYAMTGWFVGMQNTRIPMFIAIFQNLVNIAASAILVFVFHFQIEGVALGTLIAQWTGFLTALYMAQRTFTPFQKLRTSLVVTLSGLRTSFSTHFDIFLRTLCLVSVNFYFTSAGASQGALVLAVNTLLMQFFMVFSYFLDGFAYAGEALAGRFYGARDQQSLYLVIKALFGWGLLMVILFTILYGVFGQTFIRLLTNDQTVVAATGEYFYWVLLIPLCGVAAFVWDGVFIGITQTRGMLKSCSLSAIAFFSLWFLLSPNLGNHALWIALLAYLFLRGLIQTGIFWASVPKLLQHSK